MKIEFIENIIKGYEPEKYTKLSNVDCDDHGIFTIALNILSCEIQISINCIRIIYYNTLNKSIYYNNEIISENNDTSHIFITNSINNFYRLNNILTNHDLELSNFYKHIHTI